MASQRRSLLILIALGGSAVLGSYVLALVGTPELRSGLWGGLPESLKGAYTVCLLYTSPSPRDQRGSRMPSSA